MCADHSPIMEKAWFTGLTWCGQCRAGYGTAPEQGMFSVCGNALARLINKTFTAQRRIRLCFFHRSSHPFDKCAIGITVSLTQPLVLDTSSFSKMPLLHHGAYILA